MRSAGSTLCHCRYFSLISAAAARPFFVTTPVFYANSLPHIGHLYTCLLADAYARHARLARGGVDGAYSSVLLSTGTDEHGQKVAAAAAAAGVTPEAWCGGVSLRFSQCASTFGISAGEFTRTTSMDHGRVVRWLWRRLAARGHLYLGRHEGWYCASDEAFLADFQTGSRNDYLGRRGLPPLEGSAGAQRVSLESGHAVEWVSEENVKFRLAALAPALSQHYAANPGFVQPRERLGDLAAFVASGDLKDLSVSRSRERVPWALLAPPLLPPPAADQQPHSIYVWLDALCSYLTAALAPAWRSSAGGSAPPPGAAGELPCSAPPQDLFPHWPADLHIVGKDILKFHAVYWPAFLMAAGLPLPRAILAHGHFTVARQKMSKSLGNCIDPMALLLEKPPGGSGGAEQPPPTTPAPPGPSTPAAAPTTTTAAPTATTPCLPEGAFTVDGVRFALLREGIVCEDGDMNPSVLEQRATKECADTFGNLASRLLTLRFMPIEGRLTVVPIPLALPWGGGP